MRHSIIIPKETYAAFFYACGVCGKEINLHYVLMWRRWSSVKYRIWNIRTTWPTTWHLRQLTVISIYEATCDHHIELRQLSCSNESDKKDCYINMCAVLWFAIWIIGRVGFVKTCIAPDPIFAATIWIIIRLKYLMTRPNNTVLCTLCSRFRNLRCGCTHCKGILLKNLIIFTTKWATFARKDSIVFWRSLTDDVKIIKRRNWVLTA